MPLLKAFAVPDIYPPKAEPDAPETSCETDSDEHSHKAAGTGLLIIVLTIGAVVLLWWQPWLA